MIKKLKVQAALILAFIAAVAVPLGPLALVGCAGGCATVESGSETLVVRAEQTYQGAGELFKTFTTFEFNNRAYLRTVSGDIEKAANTIRTDGFDAVAALQQAVVTYKASRTTENRTAIETWLQRVEALERLVIEYLARAKPQQ